MQTFGILNPLINYPWSFTCGHSFEEIQVCGTLCRISFKPVVPLPSIQPHGSPRPMWDLHSSFQRTSVHNSPNTVLLPSEMLWKGKKGFVYCKFTSNLLAFVNRGLQSRKGLHPVFQSVIINSTLATSPYCMLFLDTTD